MLGNNFCGRCAQRIASGACGNNSCRECAAGNMESLAGKRLVIFGCGYVGAAVARWAQVAGLRVTAGIDGHRYWVEGRLPLATLRALGVLKPGARELYAGVYRGEFSHDADGSVHRDWLTWVDPHTEKPDFHVPQSFGRLVLE